ncbi:MAG: hypothetical protein QXR14_04945 [Sulfolobales archaeon]
MLRSLKEEAVKEYKGKVRRRKEFIRRFWRLLDIFGEQKVLQRIKRLEREAQRAIDSL